MPVIPTIVHYVLPRSPRKHRPAIVTRIHNDGSLDLHVMTTARGGRFPIAFNARNIRRDVTARVGGTWHEMETMPDHVIADYVAPDVQADNAARALNETQAAEDRIGRGSGDPAPGADTERASG